MKLHKPVLLEQTIELLNLKSGQTVVDMTAGYGGHSEKILGLIGPAGRLVLVDTDIEAIGELKNKFSASSNVEYIHCNFADIDWKSIGKVDKVLMDIGVSSPQLDQANRGFSFSQEAKLDMRMNQGQALTAEQVVNHYSEADLASVIYRYGEETKSRRIASAIVAQRQLEPVKTTKQLATIVSSVLPANSKINPATKTFQAIRIEVNQELVSLTRALPMATGQLKKNGRLAVISFHSLEDRIVKRYFKEITTGVKDPVTGSEISSPNYRLVNKKPIKGSIKDNNPRARSAKLRLVEKIN